MDRSYVAVEELRRGQRYTDQLRALLALRCRPGDGWSEEMLGLTNELLQAFTAAHTLLLDTPLRAADAVAPTHAVNGLEHRTRSSPESSTLSTTEQPYYDDYQWRKYGQKKIRGSGDFVREYYRCAYKENGCQATKHVQQITGGASPMYRVRRTNNHICKPASAPAAAPESGLGFLLRNAAGENWSDLPSEPPRQNVTAKVEPMLQDSPLGVNSAMEGVEPQSHSNVDVCEQIMSELDQLLLSLTPDQQDSLWD